jgi:hypothetical protein
MKSLQAAVESAGIDPQDLKLGVDIPAETLMSMDEASMDATTNALQSAGVQVLTLGASVFSAPQAARVAQWARAEGTVVVATDVLRVHSRRPGQLSLIGRKGSVEEIDMAQAVEDFKKALDICMHTEKKYLVS